MIKRKELLEALGPGWTGDDSTFTHADGYGFYISIRDKRFSVSGNWPMDSTGQTLWPSSYDGEKGGITVSATKSMAQLAAEIKRRFLPVYLPTWQKMKERADGNSRYESASQETIRKVLAADVGARLSTHGPDKSHTLYLGGTSYAYQVTAQGEDIRFEHFNCPADVAIQVLALLRKKESD